jgi:hypothetical protein
MKESYFDQPVYKPFNYGHLSFFELFFGISAGGMGEIDSMANLNVISQ